jgi:uncharacterized OB-fold protein
MSESLAGALPGEQVLIETDGFTEPFWQAASEDRLVAPRCARCGRFRLPPTPFCPSCQSDDVDWVTLSGDATVYSYAVVRGLPWLPDLTLVPVVVELPDAPGARLVSNVVRVSPDHVHIGMRLKVVFDGIAGGRKIPHFTPAD